MLWPRWWAVCLNSRHRNTNVHKLKQCVCEGERERKRGRGGVCGGGQREREQEWEPEKEREIYCLIWAPVPCIVLSASVLPLLRSLSISGVRESERREGSPPLNIPDIHLSQCQFHSIVHSKQEAKAFQPYLCTRVCHWTCVLDELCFSVWLLSVVDKKKKDTHILHSTLNTIITH